MSKLIPRLKEQNRATVRGAAMDVPLHICLQTLQGINGINCYHKNAAIEVGDTLFVVDAP